MTEDFAKRFGTIQPDDNGVYAEFYIKVEHLPSVNNMYEPRLARIKGSRDWKFLGMMLSKEARGVKEDIKAQVKSIMDGSVRINEGRLEDVLKLGAPIVSKQIPKTEPLILDLTYYFKNLFFVRDTSNLVKLVEDGIYETIDVNDAMNVDVNIKKRMIVGQASEEYIYARIRKMDKDYRLYLDSQTEDPESAILEDSFIFIEED